MWKRFRQWLCWMLQGRSPIDNEVEIPVDEWEKIVEMWEETSNMPGDEI